MLSSRKQHVSCHFILLAAILLSGCGQYSDTSSVSQTKSGGTGTVHGGQQPVSGATIQLYAVGTAGGGSAATPLLTTPVQTDANGFFAITGLYTCPTGSTLVYLMASGGNPGLTASTNNTSIALLAAIGQCQTLSNSTFVVINEVTTVAAVSALAPYFTSPTAIGSASSDAAALSTAFTLAAEYANNTAGSSPGPNIPDGYSVPVTEIYTLADIIASCVNSGGGVAGDSSNCGNLFTDSTPSGGTAPTDVAIALWDIFNNPTGNVQSLLGMVTPNPPFQPALSTAPPNWLLALSTPALTVSPASLTFPVTSPGFLSTAQSVMISNLGSSAITISSASLTGANPGDFSIYSNCPVSLLTGQTCPVTVVYKPTVTGASSAGLAIANSGTTSTISVALSGTGTAVVANTLVTADALSGVPINQRLYGVNNIWYYIPDTSFDAFTQSMLAAGGPNATGVGMTMMRFPGGFESESYQWYGDATLGWTANTVDSGYRNTPAVPGATPDHIIHNVGNGNVSFVVRTQDALKTADYQDWAGVAANLVGLYGNQVQDWQIGNEWYNSNGSQQSPDQYLTVVQEYGRLVGYYAPAMKKKAKDLGVTIRIWVTVNWAPRGQDGNSILNDLTLMKAAANAVDPSGWSDDVDGLDIHPYSGIDPSSTRPYPSPPLWAIPDIIATLKSASGKNLIYGSEWSADREDNDKYGGLKNAGCMVQIVGQLARSGMTQAAYWPPVFDPAYVQADTITLANYDTYALDADGQAYGWLSSYYTGSALSTTVQNSSSGVTSIAAKNSNGQIVVFVVSGASTFKETVDVQVNGASWSTIQSAEALYANNSQGTIVTSGSASVNTAITANKVLVNGRNAAEFTLSPGGSNRGNSFEIVKLVLQ
jgi:hypothetical protein